MGHALALGIVCAPFISAALYGLGRARRALTTYTSGRSLMPLFLLGLALGGLSGGVTYGLTTDGQLSALIGAVVAVMTWLGVAAVIFIDD
ncbi:hypothetical protein JL475_24450 [Streptomyces sp. M2CJ-2]|uniref:hypothetical protein n=1 Tax=Streptomyces sp. M2CJ-2 TaxID=2803948 RepID=UPI00192859C0|nr:hypothetical protein [Streptomyces sp. M2CJ-2]MBL3669087.1 hypothetical protein [Streptomyces sp. M2CJ-2]